MSKRNLRIDFNRLFNFSLRTTILIAFTTLGISMAQQAKATHAMGGDVTYECIGTDQYRVVLNFYRDCNGIAAPTDCSRLDFTATSAMCGGLVNGCFVFESVEIITPLCFAAPDQCNDPSGIFGVERHIYAANIDLSAWSGCGTDWLIEWDLCCRNNAITSLLNPGGEELYLSALLDNTLDDCNSSPIFLNDPTPFSCVNTPLNYNHGVSDPDGDSLVFSFAPARGAGGALIGYAGGYSFTNPILTAGGADAPAIDPVTGTITAVPNVPQFAVVTVLVQEYRDQNLIGEFTRDVQFSITNIPSCANNPPEASGIGGTTNFTMEVCADSTFCFDIFSTDLDVADSVTMFWNNGIPTATFMVGAGLTPTGTFCWTPTSANIGVNLFSVTVRDNACVLNGVNSYGYAITVTPPDAPADAGSDQIICATSTTMAAVLPFTQSPRVWSLVSGAGTINNPSDPTTLITGLGVGDNVFEWSINYQTCGTETDQVTITVFDAGQAAANAGPDQSFCLPTTSATMAANAAPFPAAGAWTISAGTGVFADANDPLSSVTGLSQGLNTFQWEIDNGPCVPSTTADAVDVFIFDNTQVAADAGPDQEFCTPTTTATMAANAPTFPATGMWTLIAGSGVATTPTSSTSGITGLAVGENIFEWTIINAPCLPLTTSDQVSIFIFDASAAAANAGLDQELCTPVSSTALTANTPTVPAIGNWTLISGTGVFGDPADPSTIVTGLTVGENIFEWEIDNGACGAATTDQVSIFLFDAVAPVANAGSDQDFCTPTNTAAMAANTPLFPATGAWTLVAGTGTFTDATSPTTTVTGITVGINTYRWTISNGPCPTASTQDDMSVTIFDNNTPLADAGLDQEFCTPTSSTTVTGNILLGPAAGLWTLVSGTGNIGQPTNPVSLITGLSIGENIFQWEVDNGPCNAPTSDQISIFIFDENSPVANAGADQNFCLPTNSTNLAGSVPVFPAVGTWSLISGGGTITDLNDPISALTAIPVGENVFQWTMDNGPCATGITTDQVSIFIFDNNNPAADAGPDQELCTPTTSTGLAGSTVTFPGAGTWTVQSGSGSFIDDNDPMTTVSGLSIGDNILRWTVNNGPCVPSVTFDEVSVFVFDLNAAPANAGPDQDLCSPSSTGTMAANTPTAPAIGTWSVTQGSGNFTDVNNPVALVTGMSVGENIFEWSIDNGICGISSDQVSVFIYDPNQAPANAGPDQSFCTPTSTATMAGNALTFPASGQWVLISGGGTITDNTDPTTSITALPIGENVFQWTVDNGPCVVTGTSDQMTISIFDENGVNAAAGPDQEFCTPTSASVMAANLPTFPSTGVWSLVSGTGAVAQPANPFSAVTGLTVGENIFEWTIDNTPCANGVTTDQISIFIFDGSNPTANAGPDQELCTPTTSTSLAGSAITFPAAGTWTLTQGTGVFTDATDPTTAVSGLSVGENIFQWDVDNGPCAAATNDLVSIFVFDNNQAVADAGTDQELCTPVTSTNMTANAVTFPAVGTWTLISGTGTITDDNDPATLITALGIGDNIFEWEIDNGPCGAPTTDEVTITIFDLNAPPSDAGSDQEFCTPMAFTSLAGNTPVGAGVGTWTLIQGTGTFVDLNDPTTTVNALTVGENIFEWSIDNGTCGISTDQVSVFIFDQSNAVADAGADQAFCTPTSTATLAGNIPTFPASGLWSLVAGTGAVTTPTDPASGITGMSIGENIFEWVVDNGPCGAPSSDQVSIFIFDQNVAAANAGADQDICTPTTTTNLTGSAVVFPGVGTWTLIQGAGALADANDPTTGITGLTVGENIFEWSVDNGPCGAATSDQVSIFLFDQSNPISNAGPDQDLCTPTTSTSLAGSSITFPASGTWTLTQGTGVFTDATDPTTAVSGLSVGENIFQWDVDNGPCAAATNDLVSIFVFDNNQAAADAGTDQELCTPVTSTNMTANAVTFPGVGTWTLISGTGTITDDNDPATLITALGIGDNIFEWEIDNGPCGAPTADEVTITIFDLNAPPSDAGSDQEFCTPMAFTSLAGNTPVGAGVGTWTLIQGTGTFVDLNDPTTTVNALTVGENIFEWSIDNGTCGISTDQVSVFIFDQNNAVADAGIDQDFCSPTSTATLSGNVPTFPASGLWSLVAGTGAITTPTDPASGVTGLTIGENIFEWVVDNGPCGAPTSDQVSIFIFDQNAPAADAGPDQDICTPTTFTDLAGSAVNFPGIGTWTLIQGTGAITDANDPTTGITGLTVGENIFEWSVDNGPCAAPSTDQVSIFLFDENNASADAGSDQDLCTPNTSTNLAGNAPTFPAFGTWTLIQGTGAIADANDPATGITGLTVGENIFQWEVDNGPCGAATTDQVSIFIFDNTAAVANAGADQQLCTPVTSTNLTGNAVVFPAVGTWTLISGVGTIADPNDPNTLVTGLGIGTIVLQWEIDNGPCAAPTNDQVSISLFDLNAPPSDAGPDQDLCTPTTSTNLAGNTPVGAGIGTWSVIQGTGLFTDASDENTLVSALSVGENIFEWSIDNGTCGISTDQVSIFLFDGNAAAANAGPDQDICSPQDVTLLEANVPTFPAVGTWSLVQGTGVFTDVNTPNTLVNGMSIGENIFEWSIDNGPCGPPSTDQVSIFIFDINVPFADAGPDQQLCSNGPTTELAGNFVIFPGQGTWSLIAGSGLFFDINNPNMTVGGLSIGQNIFEWTIDNGPCHSGSADQVSIFVFDENNPEADAGADQELCTPNTSTSLEGNVPTFPAIGTWTLVQGTGVFGDPNDPTTTITGLTVGENIFQWEIDNGPCTSGITNDEVSIFVFDGNADVADAGTDQQLCTPVTSTNMTANSAIFPGVGTWTLISGTGTITDANDEATLITGLGIGDNIFQWEIDNGPCGVATNDQVTLTIFDLNAPPSDAGPDQDLCTPTTSTNLAGNTPVGAGAGFWSVIQGTGLFTDANDENTLVSGLSVGENIFEWSIDNGTCGISTDQVSVFIFDQNNAVADAGTDQEFCTPTSTATLAGNVPTFPASGLWSLVAGTGAVTTPDDPASGVTGLTIGENIFEWVVDNGPCGAPTSDQVSIFIFDQNATAADAGLDQNICTPTISTNLAGSAVVFPGVGTWILIQGTGAIIDANDPTTGITGLTVGENIFEWSVDNGPCAAPSTDQVSIFLFDENNASADAGPDQDLCTPNTSTNLAGNAPTFPAFGTWTLIQGTGAIANANDPATGITGLTVGENIFQWEVDNGPCGAPTTDLVSIFVFDNNAAVADAGADQELCTPVTSTNMTGNAPVFPAFGTWTLISGTGTIGDPSDPGTLVMALGIGDNVFQWEIDNGPCAQPTSDFVTITIFDLNAAPADAGPDQDLCTPISSTPLDGNTPVGAGVGTWTLMNGTGTIVDLNDPNTTVNGLTVGENIFQWEIDNGICGISTDLVSIFLFDGNAQAADAGPDQEFCTPISTTDMFGNSPIFPGIGTWTLVGGTGVIVDPSDQNTEVTGLTVGENIFEWSIDNGPCAPVTSDQVSIFIFDDSAPQADAGPDQDFCLPTTFATMAANNAVFPGVGTWSILQGTGIFTDANDPLTLVTGLTVGENIFQWSIDNGPCGQPSNSAVSIFIFDSNNANADAGPDQDLCTPNINTNLAGNVPIIPSFGTWYLIQGTGVVADPNDPNTSVTDLGVGENIFLWEVNNGPCANAITTDQVSIFVYDENSPVADAGPDQEICTPTSSITMVGSVPVLPSFGVWSLFSGSGTITDVNDPLTEVTGLPVGTHVFIWTVDNGPCTAGITTDTMTVEVFDVNAGGSDAGPDQSLCLPATSTNLAGNIPVSPAIGTWTLVQGTGLMANVNDPVTGITGLTVGENIFEWTIANGVCNMPIGDQVSIFIFDDSNADADAGPDQSFCTPITSTTLEGNVPIFPATGLWILVNGGGSIVDPTDPNSAVSLLPVGENIFEWTVDNGPCANGTTTDQVSIFIFDENLAVADAGPDQDFCTPISSTTLNGSAIVFPAVGTWTLFSGTGNIINPNSAVTNVTSLTVGENIFVWEVDNGPCANGLTSNTVSIFIFDDNANAADAGLNQELCTPQDSTFMVGNTPVFPATGTWTLLTGTANILDPNDPFTFVNGMPVGEHIFEWAIDNGPCTGGVTTDVVSILVYETNAPAANAGPDQELCTPQVNTVMAGSAPVFPGFGTWSLVSGTGSIIDPNDPLTDILGLVVGENVFVWQIYNGPCGAGGFTQDTVSVFLFDANSGSANAGPDQEYCTPASTATLNGNPLIFPSTGLWTLINGTGTILDPSNSVTNVVGLTVGENIFEWTVDNGPCSNDTTIDQVSIFIFDENAANADAGPDQEYCTPTSTTTLDGNNPVFPGMGMWSLVGGTGTIADATDPATTVVGLSIGENIFEWTIDNGPCANGITSDLVSIFVFDSVQPPANAGFDQELCSPTTSTTMNGSPVIFPATGTWTLLGGAGTINDPNDPGTMVTGLGIGENIFVWTIDNGPCVPPTFSDTVSIFVFDGDALDAMAGPDQDFCSPINSTTMLANTAVFPAIGTWVLLSGAATISDNSDPFSTITDLGFGENLFEWQIDNGPCGGLSSDQMSIFLFDSSVSDAYAGEDQIQCEDSLETNLEADPAQNTGTGFWTAISGTGIVQDASDPSTLVTDLEIGDHVFVWTVDNGTCGTTMDTVVVTIDDCTTFVVPNAFSPNGDGTNDVFEITNILSYPNNKFQVYNRWGSLVYEASPYVNEWDGRSSTGLSTDQGLPESTYYYILDLGNDSDVLNGFIYLRR